MARVETIIVGGGIAAGNPFLGNAFTYVQTVQPPAIATSPLMSQVLGAHQAIVISATGDPVPLANEVLRIRGGFISEQVGFARSFIAGEGAIAAAADAIAIGFGAGIGRNFPGLSMQIGSGAVAGGAGLAIGHGAFTDANSGTTAHLAIGHNARCTAVSAAAGSTNVGSGTVASPSAVCVGGNGCNAASTSYVAVGGNTASNAVGSCVFGFGSIAIHASAIIFGAAIASTRANQCLLGSPTTDIRELRIGQGVVNPFGGTLPSLDIKMTESDVYANNQGGDMNITPGLSTGNAQEGRIVFKTGAPVASGGTPQTAAARLTVQAATILLDASVTLTVSKDRGVVLNNQTSAAAAQAGTLLNSPTAGDPGHWLKIVIGGVNYAIPCWLG
jgi:hypothetical protein